MKWNDAAPAWHEADLIPNPAAQPDLSAASSFARLKIIFSNSTSPLILLHTDNEYSV